MATPATESKPLTVEDVYSMPRDGRKYELIAGELVINPKAARADGSAAIVRADGALDGEAVLPGFRCALAEIL